MKQSMKHIQGWMYSMIILTPSAFAQPPNTHTPPVSAVGLPSNIELRGAEFEGKELQNIKSQAIAQQTEFFEFLAQSMISEDSIITPIDFLDKNHEVTAKNTSAIGEEVQP